MSQRSYSDYPEFYAPLFEVTRRYKIMNPEKMRDTYGKLVYLLQDANTPEMMEELGFSLVAPIKTVHAKLKECGALALLSDEAIAVATQVPRLPPRLHWPRRLGSCTGHAASAAALATPPRLVH